MSDRKVKGTMLVDMVRMIRATKDREWDEYLTPEDWKIVMETILPSSWYPLELYQKLGVAVFRVLAGGDTEITRLRGKTRGKELFEDVYRNIVSKKDPMAALSKFVNIYGNLFNFSSLKFEQAGGKHALVKHDYDPDDPGNVPYCYLLMGHLEVLVEMTGGENVTIELTSKQWEGDPITTFDIKWE